MSDAPNISVQHFPENPADRQFCLVWTRKADGQRVRFHCSTEDDCRRQLPRYRDRARVADKNGWKDL